MKKIRVKQEHIERGIQESPCCCPIALALKEQINTFDSRFVQVLGRFVSLGYYEKRIQLPRSAKRFVRRFDYGYKTKPFNFVLDI